MDIRVYHREGGKETWGYFATNEKASPQSYSMQDDHSFTLFDGTRLRIHFIGVPKLTKLQSFDLDITFLPASEKWSGTWSRSSQHLHVVLTRPEPDRDVRPSALVGDWMGQSTPNSPQYPGPGTLHIRESLDGVLSAWLDSTSSVGDPQEQSMHNYQSKGERLNVCSATDTGLVLETTTMRWDFPLSSA